MFSSIALNLGRRGSMHRAPSFDLGGVYVEEDTMIVFSSGDCVARVTMVTAFGWGQ